MKHLARFFQLLLAGGVGGLVNSLALWGCGALGITTALGFAMAPALTVSWLLPRIMVSAIWGLLFLLPFWEERIMRKGLLLSLAPSCIMLFMVFPKMGAGMLGLKLGNSAPLFAVFFTLIWGGVSAMMVKTMRSAPKRYAKEQK